MNWIKRIDWVNVGTYLGCMAFTLSVYLGVAALVYYTRH